MAFTLEMADDFYSGGYDLSVQICFDKYNCAMKRIGDTSPGEKRDNVMLNCPDICIGEDPPTVRDEINCSKSLTFYSINVFQVEIRSSSSNEFKPKYIQIFTNEKNFNASWNSAYSRTTGNTKTQRFVPSELFLICRLFMSQKMVILPTVQQEDNFGPKFFLNFGVIFVEFSCKKLVWRQTFHGFLMRQKVGIFPSVCAPI